MMKSEEFSFWLHGAKIFGYLTEPEKIDGVVVFAHGLGEHSGRYKTTVIPMLTDLNLAVMCYDNIGHGKSSGKRGHCPNYNALLDILNAVYEKACARYDKLPVFLYGHSMGGNLILNFALRCKPEVIGIVATSPYLRLAFQPPKWKMKMGMWLLRCLPSITMPSGLDPNGISRIPEEVEKYKNDPLVHDRVSPMYTFPVMDAGEWIIGQANLLQIDTLLLHGTGDPIIDFRGTEEFHTNACKTTLQLLEGGYHELHHDLSRDELFESIVNWFKQRLD